MNIRTILLSCLIFLGLFTNCSNNDDVNTDSFKATVLRQGNKCGIIDDNPGVLDYLIEFNANVLNLPEVNNTIYYAANLPENYKVEGLEISITFRDINTNDDIICNTVVGGDDYPFIYILSAD